MKPGDLLLFFSLGAVRRAPLVLVLLLSPVGLAQEEGMQQGGVTAPAPLH